MGAHQVLLLTLAAIAATTTAAQAQRAVRLTAPGLSPTMPEISDDGRMVAFVSTGGVLNFIRSDGLDLRSVPGVSAGLGLDLDADGRYAVVAANFFSSSPSSRALLIDTSTFSQVLLSGAATAYLPAISADGSRVAHEIEGGYTLDIMRSDATGLVHVPASYGTGIIFGPSLTADGSVVVYDVDDSDTGTFEIWHVGADGTGAARITSPGGDQEIAPRVSADGSKILYMTVTGALRVMNGDGSGAIQLNAGQPPVDYWGEALKTLALSADGRVAAWGGGGSVFSVRTDASRQRQIGRGRIVSLSGDGDLLVWIDNTSAATLWVAGVPGIRPGEIHDLDFAADGTSLGWEGRASANVYNLYRGDLASLPTSGTADCLSGNIPSPGGSDGETPLPGHGWYYIATGENGAGEGTAGASTAGAPRLSTGACPPSDADGDGFPDANDPCPLHAQAVEIDDDGDGIGNACDNCPQVYNPDQRDLNGDGIGDAAAPVAQVLSPNGGETLTIGQPVAINWSATDDCGATLFVTISLSRNGVSGSYQTIASNVPNSGSYSWTVTGPATVGSTGFVRITASAVGGGGFGSDKSDAGFSIQN